MTTIEITRPEVEALIRQRLQSGAFRDAEEVILHALHCSASQVPHSSSKRTGAELVDAMQSMPYKDIDIEPARPHLPVRDAAF